MVKSVMMMLGALLLVVALVENTVAAPYQDDKYLDQSLVGGGEERELASWLMELARHNERVHKRNSEIINSLLGLPKVLNDAGR